MGLLTKKRFTMMINPIHSGMTLAPTFLALKKYKEAVAKQDKKVR